MPRNPNRQRKLRDLQTQYRKDIASAVQNINENYQKRMKRARGGRLVIPFPWMVAGLAGAWLLYSRFGIDHNADLPPAIDAARQTFSSIKSGTLSYYADRTASGRPLVLLHSINAAGSSYEMRPLFQHYRKQRPVYALDLPGFGFSERSDRPYTPKLYTDAILSFLELHVKEKTPVDVVALSLASEFAAMAAHARPDLIRSLALISPSGFRPSAPDSDLQPADDQGRNDWALRALRFPLWSQGLYDLLATMPSIKWFLRRSFEGPLDEGLAEYSYLTAHRPGARYAPLVFVSGKLFTRNVRETVYAHLSRPALVLYDTDPYVSFDALPDMLQKCSNWRAQRIVPTRGLPHWEKPADVTAALDKFWSEL